MQQLITLLPGVLGLDGAKSTHSHCGSCGVELPGYFMHVAIK